MALFSSPAWIAAMDAAAQASTLLSAATTDLRLVVEQRITGTPDGDIVFHLLLDHGSARVVAGPASDPTVSFSQDMPTATAIAGGTMSAQRAFMAGTLRVGGDLRVLLDHQDVLAGLTDIFRAVREDSDVSEAR